MNRLSKCTCSPAFYSTQYYIFDLLFLAASHYLAP
uniref:Uncharacterized protein n=1 Tax=Arundo donax TaxID=35708 RepID=A0A0A9FN90_ARUDO